MRLARFAALRSRNARRKAMGPCATRARSCSRSRSDIASKSPAESAESPLGPGHFTPAPDARSTLSQGAGSTTLCAPFDTRKSLQFQALLRMPDGPPPGVDNCLSPSETLCTLRGSFDPSQRSLAPLPFPSGELWGRGSSLSGCPRRVRLDPQRKQWMHLARGAGFEVG